MGHHEARTIGMEAGFQPSGLSHHAPKLIPQFREWCPDPQDHGLRWRIDPENKKLRRAEGFQVADLARPAVAPHYIGEANHGKIRMMTPNKPMMDVDEFLQGRECCFTLIREPVKTRQWRRWVIRQQVFFRP